MSSSRTAGRGANPASKRVDPVGKERLKTPRGAEGRVTDGRAGETKPPRRKDRGLLRAFYGLQDAAGEAKAKAERRINPLDIGERRKGLLAAEPSL